MAFDSEHSYNASVSFTQNDTNRYCGFTYDPHSNIYKSLSFSCPFDPTIRFQVHHNASKTSLYLKLADDMLSGDMNSLTLKINLFSFNVKTGFMGTGTVSKTTAGELRPFPFKNQVGWESGYNFNQNEYSRTVTFYVKYQRLVNGNKPELNHAQLLCGNLELMRKSAQFSDVILSTGDGVEFPVHKFILAAHSPVFSTMFGNENFEENAKNRAVIEDVSSEVMETMLAYLYSADTTRVKEFAVELLVAAHKYDIKSLVSECVRQLLASITVANSAQLLFYADIYELDELKTKVIRFVCHHGPKEVIQTEGWKLFVRPKPELMEHLLERMAEYYGQITGR